MQESPKYESDEDVRRGKQETERQSFEGADRVTVEMMDSTDIPVQRSVFFFYSTPFCHACFLFCHTTRYIRPFYHACFCHTKPFYGVTDDSFKLWHVFLGNSATRDQVVFCDSLVSGLNYSSRSPRKHSLVESSFTNVAQASSSC